MKSSSSPLVYGAILAIARGLPILALLFASLRLTNGQFGQVAVVVTAAATAALFADSGTDSAATWLFSRTGISQRAPLVSALFYYRSLVACIATLLLVGAQIQLVDGDSGWHSLVVTLCCVGNMLSARNSSNRIVLRIESAGEKRSVLLEKAAIGILFALATSLVPAEPMWVLIGYGIASVFGGLVASRAFRSEEWRTSLGNIRELAKATLPFVATTACSAMIWRLPTFVLGQTGQLAEAGYLALASYPIILVTSIPVLAAPLLLVRGGTHGVHPLATVRRGAVAGVVCAVFIASGAFLGLMLPLEEVISSNVLSTVMILSAASIPLWINPLMVATLRVRRGLWAPFMANISGAVVACIALIPLIMSWQAEGAATTIVLAECVILGTLLIILIFKGGRGRHVKQTN